MRSRLHRPRKPGICRGSSARSLSPVRSACASNSAAFTHGGPWLDALLAQLDHNRRLLTELLARELPGVRYIEPQASYLAWLDCSVLDLGPDPVGVFLERGRVALTRGRDFGPESGAFVRVNMGTSSAILTEVVRRMAASVG
jgi:cystathionine beta-lyase